MSEWDDLIGFLRDDIKLEDLGQSPSANTSMKSENFGGQDSVVSDSSYFSDCDAYYDDEEAEFSESEPSRSESKTNNLIAPKKCTICGEPTNCCHYDVPSCSGCKTFFRRSVLSAKEPTCKRDGKCDVKNGVKCRACRFNRCILVGMNPAGMQMAEDEKNVVINRIRERKRTLLMENRVDTDDLSLVAVAKKVPVLEQTVETRNIDFLVFLETKMAKMRESNYNPRPLYFKPVSEVLKRKTALRFSDRYEKANWPAVKYPQEPPPGPPKRHWMAIDVILTIEAAKVMPVFDKLDFQDKEAVIKNVVLMNAMLMEAFYTNLKHKDTVTMPDGMMPILNPHGDDIPTKLQMEVFCRVLEPVKRIGLTFEEYTILKAIMLCTPTADGISQKGRKMLQKESEKYSKLLLRHMQNEFGVKSGATRYSQIMAIFEAMAHFAQRHKELHLLMKMAREAHFQRNSIKIPQDMTILEEVLR
uniref:Uncharacterized protein n=1 Tax=Panagrolaimus sp. JU765 TaxID=591449 RepID=A0AC34QPW0_9BILA